MADTTPRPPRTAPAKASRTARTALKWNGAAIIAKQRRAQLAAVNQVCTQCARAAAAETPVDTGRAQRSVHAQPAQTQGNRTSAVWGSVGVPYYIFLELRGNMLRNAADQHYPTLAQALAAHLQAGGRLDPPEAV